MWCCLCAARLTRASVSSARRSLLFCFCVHGVFLACALVLLVSFLSQIYARLLGTCTFTLPARRRDACVAVLFLCGRVGCGCPTCVREPWWARSTGSAGDGAGVRDEDTSRPIWSCTRHQVGTRHALNAQELGQFRSRDRNCSVFKNNQFNQYFASETSLQAMSDFYPM